MTDKNKKTETKKEEFETVDLLEEGLSADEFFKMASMNIDKYKGDERLKIINPKPGYFYRWFRIDRLPQARTLGYFPVPKETGTRATTALFADPTDSTHITINKELIACFTTDEIHDKHVARKTALNLKIQKDALNQFEAEANSLTSAKLATKSHSITGAGAKELND